MPRQIKDGQRLTSVDLSSLFSVPGQLSNWFAIAPDDSPIFLRFLNTSEVSSLDWNDE